MNSRTSRVLVAVAVMLLGAVLAPQAEAEPIYVTPTGTGGGTGWGDATSLTNAMRICQSNDAIWMTGGTYSMGTVVTVSVAVTWIGGFAGTESTPAERALTNALGVVTNYSAINGENARSCLRITNAAGVVSMEAIALTNALYSWANGGAVWKSAAGTLVMNNCRVVGNRSASYSSDGVGCTFTGGTVLMTNCVIATNRLESYSTRGGGIYSSGVNLTMVDCVVSNNYGSTPAASYNNKGVGLWFDAGTLVVRDTLFVTNSAGGSGGGGGGAVYLNNSATMSATFTRCVFRGNQFLNNNGAGGYGGAVALYLNASRTSTFVNCDFTLNENATADGRGGAIYQSAGTVNLKNCILWTNRCSAASGTGHEISVGGGTMNVSYSDLSGLVAPYIDGTANLSNSMAVNPLYASATDLHLKSAAGRWDPATSTWVNDAVTSPCIDGGDPGDSIGAEPTDNGNVRINMGIYGGLAQASKTQPVPAPQVTDRGTVVHYDRARISGELTNQSSVLATVTLYYGLTDGGTAPGSWDRSISFGYQTEGTVLSQWTPTLLANTWYTYRWFATNSAGGVWTETNRFQTGSAATGGGTNVIHISPVATGAGDGTSWQHAFTTVRGGLGVIGGARTNVWITGGAFTEGIHFNIGQSSVVIGGFAGTETAVSQRALTNALGVVTNYTTFNGSNAYSCLRVTGGDVTLQDLAFTNALYSWANGGALYKSGSGTLVMNNCRVVGNRSTSYNSDGVGCCFTAGTVLMTNCVIATNRLESYGARGGGIYSGGANLTMVDCVVSNNYGTTGAATSGTKGVGLWFDAGTLVVRDTLFVTNSSGGSNSGGGGAVYLHSSATMSATFTRCMFRGNQLLNNNGVGGYGGAVWANLNASRTSTFVNCDFTLNENATLDGRGGAIYQSAGTVNLKNCILWTNRCSGANGAGQEVSVAAGTMNVSYSDLSGLASPHIDGTANLNNCIAANPLYASATDLHLKSAGGRWDPATATWVNDAATSSCIDGGDPGDSIGAEPTDNGNVIINQGVYGGTAQASKSPLGVPPPQLADREAVVSYDRAKITGELTNSSSVSANAFLCYGLGDGGMTTGAWATVIFVGLKSDGTPFSQWTPALSPATVYHYRWYAANVAGSNWTEDATFLTGSTAPGGGTNVIHVYPGATGAADGTSWPHAFTTMRDGLAAIGGVRTNVWITGGNYTEGLHFSLAQSVKLIGGFVGTESAVSQRALTNASGVVTNYATINGSNAYSCLKITAGDVLLEALAITNGLYTYANGGALSKSGSGTLVMNNCRVVGNQSSAYGSAGAGCSFTAGTVWMTNCVVANNRLLSYDVWGGGIYSAGANLTMVDCVVSSNGGGGVITYRSQGVGLHFDNGNLNVLRTDFLCNTGGVNRYKMGAGVYLGNSATMSASFSNCVFRGNRALEENGALYGGGYGAGIGAGLNSNGKTVSVVNCTFSDNRNATTNGAGGAIAVSNGTVVIRNSIFWTNSVIDGVSGSEIYAFGTGSLVTNSYSCFSGTNAAQVLAAGSAVVKWGPGIITNDPLYASATDVHLKSQAGHWDAGTSAWVRDEEHSPCIDRGDPNDSFVSEPEPNGRRINMGAYGGTIYASRSLVMGSIFRFR